MVTLFLRPARLLVWFVCLHPEAGHGDEGAHEVWLQTPSGFQLGASNSIAWGAFQEAATLRSMAGYGVFRKCNLQGCRYEAGVWPSGDNVWIRLGDMWVMLCVIEELNGGF